jgi:hypothetical protein
VGRAHGGQLNSTAATAPRRRAAEREVSRLGRRHRPTAGAMAFNMAMKKPGKKYGLVKPKANKGNLPSKAAGIFAAAAEEDEDEAPMTAHQQVNYAILQAQASEARKKKAEASYAEALEQDETVFDYDGVYDQMQEKKADSAQARKKKESVRAPKYINNILKMAEYKKREEERVKERVEARERLKELEEVRGNEKRSRFSGGILSAANGCPDDIGRERRAMIRCNTCCAIYPCLSCVF